jgi:hypothetical protein
MRGIRREEAKFLAQAPTIQCLKEHGLEIIQFSI